RVLGRKKSRTAMSGFLPFWASIPITYRRKTRTLCPEKYEDDYRLIAERGVGPLDWPPRGIRDDCRPLLCGRGREPAPPARREAEQGAGDELGGVLRQAAGRQPPPHRSHPAAARRIRAGVFSRGADGARDPGGIPRHCPARVGRGRPIERSSRCAAA